MEKLNKNNLKLYQADPPQGRILVVASKKPSSYLKESLNSLDMGWDICSNLKEARDLFFLKGGHEGLIINNDITVSTAKKIILSLRDMDPNLPIFTFIDPDSLGPINPKPISLLEIKLQNKLGRNYLRKIIFANLRKARL